MLEAIAVIGTHAHVRVHIETGHLRASLAYDRGLGILAGTSQAQYAAASARTRREKALHGGIGQMVEGHLLVLVLPPELPQVARHLPAYSTRQARSFLVAGRGQRVEQYGFVRLLRVHAIHRDAVEMNI